MTYQIFTLPKQTNLDGAANILSGAKAQFYLTGTVTPTNVFADSLLTTPLANPVVADANGVWPVIYMDPAVTYKVTITTSAAVLIYSADPTNDAGLSAVNVNALLTQAGVGTALYPLIPAETTAGAIPVNYNYPYLYVDRYGTNAIPGTTSMASAAQAAINLAKKVAGEIVFPNAGPYLIDAALDCTNPLGSQNQTYSFRGAGVLGAGTYNAPQRPSLIFKHTGHAFDCTGTLGVTFRFLSFTSDPTTFPQSIFLFARNTDGSSQICHVIDCRGYVVVSKAWLINYGSENDEYQNCQIFVDATGLTGPKGAIITANNSVGGVSPYVTSTFTTIATGNQSTIDHKFIGGAYQLKTHDVNGDLFYVEDAQDLKIIAPWAQCGHSTAGTSPRSLVYFDMANGPSNGCILQGFTGENNTVNPTYGIAYSNHNQPPNNCHFSDSVFPNVTAVLNMPNGTFFGSTLGNLTNSGVGNNQLTFNNVTNSFIESIQPHLTINGTSQANKLIMSAGGYTIAARSGDDWSVVGQISWTPNTAALTVVGALSVSNTRVTYNGQTVTVSFQAQAATSIACAAGITIGGLPITNVINGITTVQDLTNDSLIGIGTTSGTNMVLPTISATGHNLQITSTYVCA